MIKFKNNYKLTFLLLLVFPTIFFSQQGVINSQKVISSMSVFKKLDSISNKEQNALQQEYATKAYPLQQLQKKTDSLQSLSQQKKLTPAQKQELDSSLKSFQMQEAELQKWLKDADKKFSDYKNTLYQPYLDKINLAIKQVAAARKLTTVFDTSSSGLLFTTPDIDITEEVIKIIK